MQIKQRLPAMFGDGSDLDDGASLQVPASARPALSAGRDGRLPDLGEARSGASSTTAGAGDLKVDPGMYSPGPAKPRGETRASFSAETWVAGPEAFIFRCQDPRRGDRWTFCVSRATLQELDPAQPFKPVAAFELLRSRIHSAASARMRVADPLVQQVLSAYDIRYARTGARKNEGKRPR